MHYTSFMAVEQTHQQLFHKVLHLRLGKRRSFLVEVLLHIYIEVIEDKVEFVGPMGYVLKLNDVGMLQLLQ